MGFAGPTADQKQIAFVNLREVRGNRFGTRGPLLYNDLFYGVDLEVRAFGDILALHDRREDIHQELN